MDAFVDDTLEWTYLAESDLPDLAELRTAVEYFDDPVTRVSLDDLITAFRRCGTDPLDDAVCGRDRRSGNIVAYGWNHVDSEKEPPRVVMTGAVHPAWRDQKIGHAVVAWQRARALEWAASLPNRPTAVWIGAYADDKATGTQRLFGDHGLSAERYFYDLHHAFIRSPEQEPPAPIRGIEFVPYSDGESEAVRLLHNLCFQSNPDFQPVSEATWLEMQNRPEFRPEWSWLAYSAGDLVGYALNNADEQAWDEQGLSEGWTDRLGVHPDHRRRGIARGLLKWSMWSFGRAGLEGAGLGIDTAEDDGILRVLSSIGYESQEMVVLLSETVPLDVA